MDNRENGGLVKKQLSLAIILFLFLPFQNCSQVNFFGNNSRALDFKSENNGIGYGGKPDYYRLVPDFTCEKKVSPVAFIHETDPTATLTENKKLACGANQQSFDIALIDHSIFQRDIVGYNEGIYEGSETTPDSIPANLVEVWCRDKKDETGIESITHFNRSTQEAFTKIFYSTPVAHGAQMISEYRQIPDFAVSRVFSASQINLQSDQFHLDVYRDQPASQFGLFKGSMSAVVEGRSIVLETSCRLGGSFDAKIWPVAQIVDSSIYMFKLSPDLNSFAFSSRTGSQPYAWNLFDSDILGKNQKQVSPNLLASGATNFEYTADSANLMYWGDASFARSMSLFEVRVDESQTSLVAPAASKFSNDFRSSGDGKRMLFKVQNPDYQTLETILQSVLVSGGIPVTINLPVPAMAFYGVFDFDVSKSANRVAFLSGYVANPELYIADVDGANLVKPIINLPSKDWNFHYCDNNLVVPDPGQFVILHANSILAGVTNFQEYVVTIDGSKVFALPLNLRWVSSSPDGLKLLLADRQNNYSVFNLQNSSLVSLAEFKTAAFSLDSNNVFGTKLLASGQLSLVSYSVINSEQSAICSAADGDSIKILEDEQHQIFIASFDQARKIIYFFVKPLNGACEKKKNGLPILSKIEVMDLSLSADQSKALVRVRETVGYKVHDSLAYFPLNGDPSIMINTPVYFGAKIEQFRFLKDSQTVLYFGDQLASGDLNAYLWHAPKP